jgi:hypothetical protein
LVNKVYKLTLTCNLRTGNSISSDPGFYTNLESKILSRFFLSFFTTVRKVATLWLEVT